MNDDHLCNDEENMFPRKSRLTGEYYVAGVTFADKDYCSIKLNFLGRQGDVKDDYLGDWREALSFDDRVHGAAIEWMKIRPRYLKHRGKLLPPELVDASAEFEEILDKYHIPYEEENGTYCIYGYR